MIREQAFEKWWKRYKLCSDDCIGCGIIRCANEREIPYKAWQAREELYQKQTCGECRQWVYINGGVGTCNSGLVLEMTPAVARKSFGCKFWEAKEGG